ncbi:cytochrome c oxidase-like protein [Phyllosticta citriasiana]|uniref:cytochrome c oxidase-like protein n=1 Tax=Phyllosticta citriasiana TaxID=595635 RepID=UPI0030FD558A
MAGDGDNDNPWTEKTAAKFNNKSLSEYYDPCQEAASRSIRCLHRNGGDRDLCSDYFQAYRDCKKQWMEARKKSRSG